MNIQIPDSIVRLIGSQQIEIAGLRQAIAQQQQQLADASAKIAELSPAPEPAPAAAEATDGNHR